MILEMDTLDDFVSELSFRNEVIDATVRFSMREEPRNEATTDVHVAVTALIRSPSNLICLMIWEGYCGWNEQGTELAEAAKIDVKRACDANNMTMRPGRIKFPRESESN